MRVWLLASATARLHDIRLTLMQAHGLLHLPVTLKAILLLVLVNSVVVCYLGVHFIRHHDDPSTTQIISQPRECPVCPEPQPCPEIAPPPQPESPEREPEDEPEPGDTQIPKFETEWFTRNDAELKTGNFRIAPELPANTSCEELIAHRMS